MLYPELFASGDSWQNAGNVITPSGKPNKPTTFMRSKKKKKCNTKILKYICQINILHGWYESSQWEGFVRFDALENIFCGLCSTRLWVHFDSQRRGQTAGSVRCTHTNTPWPLSPASPLTRAVWFHYIRPNCVRCFSTCSGRNSGVRAAEETRQECLQGHRSRGDVKAFIHTLSKSSLYRTSVFLPLQGWDCLH